MVESYWEKICQVPELTPFVDRFENESLRMTYGELRDSVIGFSRDLKLIAESETKTIIILPSKTPAFYAFALACLFSGVAPIILNARAPKVSLGKILKTAQRRFRTRKFIDFSDGSPAVAEAEPSVADVALKLGFEKFEIIHRVLHANEDSRFKFKDRDNQSIGWIYFTSGTTGVPKAIPVSWKAVCSLVENILHHVPHVPGSRVSQVFSPSFDPFFADLLGAAIQGATLVPILDSEAVDLFRVLRREQITHLAATPSFVRISLMRAEELEKISQLRRTIFTGESLNWDLANEWRKWAPASTIENFYGPTETTVWISRYVVPAISTLSSESAESETVPIGQVFSNHQSLIGKNGELLIRGPQVFVDAPLSQDGFFATGDEVKVASDGEMQWVGRLDSIVKLRGQRIDLQSVEQEFSKGAQVPVTVAIDSDGLHLTVFSFRKLSDEVISKGIEALRDLLPPELLPKKFEVQCGAGLDANGKRIRKTETLQHAAGFTADFPVPEDVLRSSQPHFVYFESALVRSVARVAEYLKPITGPPEIYFSVKSNPHPAVLSALDGRVSGFDVSSRGEHRLVRRLLPRSIVTASGPAKTTAWLDEIDSASVVHVDSYDELEAIISLDRPPDRITFRLAVDAVGVLKLGFDKNELNRAIELFRRRAQLNISLVGFHLYLGREAFAFSRIEDTLARVAEIFQQNGDVFLERRVFFGAGLSSANLLFSDAAEQAPLPPLARFAIPDGIRLSWEIGRAIVHASGIYVVSVIAVKYRSDRKIVIVNGGLQHLASNLTSPRHSNRGHTIKLWRDGVGFVAGGDYDPKHVTEIFGSLGTWNDRLVLPTEETTIGSVRSGDRIVFHPAGAYGPTAASSEFIGLESAVESFVDLKGEVHRSTFENRYLSITSEARE